MRINKHFPCFAAHWRLLNDTEFKVDIHNYYEDPTDTCALYFYSKYVRISFERIYSASDFYVDRIEIEYGFYEVVPYPDLMISYMKHDIAFVINEEDFVSEVVIDERSYTYSQLYKRGHDVVMVMQIHRLLMRKIKEDADIHI